jgi:plasmid stability protein
MEALTIPDLDDSIFDALKQKAAEEGKTVEEEAVELIRQGLRTAHKSVSLRERAEAIASMTPKGVVQTDSAVLVREGRDR